MQRVSHLVNALAKIAARVREFNTTPIPRDELVVLKTNSLPDITVGQIEGAKEDLDRIESMFSFKVNGMRVIPVISNDINTECKGCCFEGPSTAPCPCIKDGDIDRFLCLSYGEDIQFKEVK